MSKAEIERRLLRLENEMSELKSRLAKESRTSGRWWEEIAGSFANDPAHAEAMRLGREYRKRQRPPARRSKRSNGHS